MPNRIPSAETAADREVQPNFQRPAPLAAILLFAAAVLRVLKSSIMISFDYGKVIDFSQIR